MEKRQYITIDQLESDLDAWFSGQKDLKKIFSVFGHMQAMRIKARLVANKKDLPMPRPVLFVSGRTGSGKTYCIENFSKAMGLPYYRINASQLSQSGWSGVDMSEELEEYFQQNRNNRFKHFGIIFIDEVDKLCNRLHSSGGGDVSLGIQTSLLDILEGRPVSISKTTQEETKDLMVVLGGSFEEPRKAKENTRTIGFHASGVHKQDIGEWKDFMVESGIIAEIAGRVTDVYEMQNLKDEEIKHAILNMQDGAYTQYYNLAALYDRQFVLGEDTIKEIIEKTRNSTYGLREINTQVTRKAIEFMSKECRYTAIDTAMEVEHNNNKSEKKPG